MWKKVLLVGAVVLCCSAYGKLPNILWLTFEDTSAYELGCYGNTQVNTPNIDRLAERGIQFLQASSTAPHCSPARSTLITGCYATTFGMDLHRRKWATPADIFYPTLLRKAGYYCTNNSKTDYNSTENNKAMWDECSDNASYNSPKRGKNQPFFAVFNGGMTHMSRLTSVTIEGRRDFSKEGLDPEKLKLPPYVPDIEEMRSDFALHLEGVQDVDKWMAFFLEDLEKQGLADDTIIFFFSDHGGCLPRGKGFPFESSLRVPLLIYLPPKYEHLAPFKPGSKTDRLVGFVDFAPTLLSLIGVKPPEWMQGQAFMGKYEAAPRQLQFGFRANQANHFDPCRTVTDGRFKYIRAYLPQKPFNLRNGFQWGMPSNIGWDGYALDRIRNPERAAQKPEWLQPYMPKTAEMLFDLDADPFELNNLAGDPAKRPVLETLRIALAANVRNTMDLGFFPLSTRDKGEPLYTWVRKEKFDLDQLITLAEKASESNPANKALFIESLSSKYASIRFWGASGLSILAANGQLEECPDELKKAVNDADPSVSATAAEACCFSGATEVGLPVLVQGITHRKGEDQQPFHSSIETLSWYPQMAVSFEGYMDKIKAAGGLAGKSVLINLGKMPADKLHSEKDRKKGIQLNKSRKPIKPQPSL